MSNVPFVNSYVHHTEATDNNITIVAGLQGNGMVVLPHDVAQEPKHVADTHQMYEYNRYYACSWY